MDKIFLQSDIFLLKHLILFFDFQLAQSLAPTSEMLHSISVVRLYQDKFSRLLNSTNRGVIVAFEVAVDVPFDVNITNETIKSDIIWALDLSPSVVVSLESLELNDVSYRLYI